MIFGTERNCYPDGPDSDLTPTSLWSQPTAFRELTSDLHQQARESG